MYSIILKDGEIINLDATDVEWWEEFRMIRLYNGEQVIARINMDNVVGWVKADYITKSAESEEAEK